VSYVYNIILRALKSGDGNSADENNAVNEIQALKQSTMWLGAQDGRYVFVYINCDMGRMLCKGRSCSLTIRCGDQPILAF